MKKLRILHFPQVPCKPFIVEVDNLKEAKKIMDMLADYDLFQFENRIKPDYCNTSVLEEYCEEEREWFTWCDEETGIDDIHEYFESIDEEA